MDDGTVITRCFILSANGTATIDINRPIGQDNNSFSPPPAWEMAVQGVHLVQKRQNKTVLYSLGAPLIISCSNSYYMDKSSLGSLEKHLHPLMLVDIDGLPPGAKEHKKMLPTRAVFYCSLNYSTGSLATCMRGATFCK